MHNGTSITDIYGKERTLTSISGSYDTINERLSFKERSNITTKAKEESNEFCYISVSNARVKKMFNRQVLSGTFNGKMLDGTTCAKGKIYLINSEFLLSTASKLMSDAKVKKMDTANVIKQKYSQLVEETSITKLRANDVLKLNWKGKEVIITVWDGANEDGDEIQLFVNEHKILDKLVITQTKKVFVVPISKGNNTIKVIAMGEGTSSPCTANISLSNHEGFKIDGLITQLRKGESAGITLNNN
jgi:hypothetical protein